MPCEPSIGRPRAWLVSGNDDDEEDGNEIVCTFLAGKLPSPFSVQDQHY